MQTVALVTGAASGMGLAVAERYLAEGWQVVGLDRDPDALGAVARQLGDAFIPAPLELGVGTYSGGGFRVAH